jgi:hypothetical protein
VNHDARRVWHTLEPIHAVTYFAPGCRQAATDLGLKGFWMGYVAFRAAPLGEVGPAPLVALFANFAPSLIARAVPDAWTFASASQCLETRVASAAAALREAGVDPDACAAACGLLAPVVAGLDLTGRPLAAANAALPHDDPDPVRRLWQLCTTLREHRGDGHVASLVAAGLSGLEAHLLQIPLTGIDPERLRGARGWSEDEWEAASARLAARRIDGAARLARAELATDELAWDAGLSVLGSDGVAELEGLLAPSLAAVHDAEWIVYPNPMGLPSPRG